MYVYVTFIHADDELSALIDDMEKLKSGGEKLNFIRKRSSYGYFTCEQGMYAHDYMCMYMFLYICVSVCLHDNVYVHIHVHRQRLFACEIPGYTHVHPYIHTRTS
jgi:hypothetical protein